ncbi:reverse transcriptase-like protein [Salinibaculum rarum]|uniref:reverse transcriptase-like protein n=1 Tax=Salinibaculum rarum TaxID=3058903 RepID=UPI00265E0825|nr:reverse transcriptase-like protein [Salinibaculum sp. KK48]
MSSTPSSAPPLQPRKPTIVQDGADTTAVHTAVIETDGAYNNDEDIATIGFTIEDGSGSILQEGWQEAPGATSSMQAETVAALTAIRLSKDYDPSFVVINTDCERLKAYLTEEYAEKPVLELLCEQAREELVEFEHARVRKIKSEHNTRADELAGRGLRELRGVTGENDDIWMPSGNS